MEWLPPVLGAVIASGAAAVSAWLVARRFQKLGGGEAQDRLNTIRAELDAAMEEKLGNLKEQFEACKKRLGEVETNLTAERTKHESALRRLREERRDLREEIGQLHREVRSMKPNRDGAHDRSGDPDGE